MLFHFLLEHLMYLAHIHQFGWHHRRHRPRKGHLGLVRLDFLLMENNLLHYPFLDLVGKLLRLQNHRFQQQIRYLKLLFLRLLWDNLFLCQKYYYYHLMILEICLLLAHHYRL